MKLHSKSKMIGLSIIACLGLVGTLNAGIITTNPAASTPGYGGWNLGNVDVFVTDLDFNPISKGFNKTDGSYDTMVVGDTFESQVKDDGSVIMGKLHGKNWPVGEPPGIKVINDDPGQTQNGKPNNCIMTTSYIETAYLDTANPENTTCTSPFQTHKRFKVNLQPSTIDGGVDSIDLLFNVAGDTAMRRYQVFQKINNYTGKRLQGYTAQIGFGVGANFTAATASHDLNISLGLGEDTTVDPVGDIWDSNEMANFAHGLWGPIDKHFPVPGFFGNIRAGYEVTLDGENKIATSGATLGSNYVDLFGNWLTNQWAPTGIFYDFDDDPITDADLVAFWADVDGDGTYAWTGGGPDFTIIDDVTLAKWAMDRLYSIGKIEDVLNLGLNYIINVGDVSTYENYNAIDGTATFTIRITPMLADQSDANNTDVPGWITNPPVLGVSSQGTISITPDPFAPGTALTVRVMDADLNEDNATAETVVVSVVNDQGESESLLLTEADVNLGVFQGVLETNSTTGTGTDDDGVLHVTEGTLVTATYIDANSSDGVDIPRINTATASTSAAPAPQTLADNNSAKSIFSATDNVSLIAMIIGFLGIGAFIARRKLAK